MADFLEEEAEESDEDYQVGQGKRRPIVSSDDDEEEDDGDGEDLKDLIDDNPEPDEESDGEADKRKHEDSELEEDLSEDDYDLIEENLGIKVKRKPHKRKRIKIMSDDEDSDRGEGHDEVDDREAVANELFEGDDEEAQPPEEEQQPKPVGDEFGDLDASEESDVDDFIVDDEGQPISTKKKKHIIHDDKALQEAQDIFGVDFDFDEFDQYGDDFDEEEEEEEDEYEVEPSEEVGEDGEVVVRQPTKKAKKKRPTKLTIFDVFEPSELERGHITSSDQEIRMLDLPERFQLRRLKVCPTEEGELEEEADWIFKYAFNTPSISQVDSYEAGDGPGQYGSGNARRDPSTVHKIKSALDFMRNQQFEVPFLAFYRKEYVEPELNINDLWKVYHWDEKWMQLRNRKNAMIALFERMQQWQFDQIDPDQPLDSSFRALTEEDIERGKTVQTMEELRDVYQHFLLYYGADIPKMKNAMKEKRRQRRMEGEGEEGQEDIEDEAPGDQLKQATRQTSYTMCKQNGLAEIARKFGLTPEQFGENMRDNYQRHDVEQDPAEPDELTAEFIKGAFRTKEEVLEGACHMVAMQIAHDPLTRQCVRTTFYERAKISIKPTKMGMKVIDESHPCYPFMYVCNKPVKDLQDEQFLKIHNAVTDKQLTYQITIDSIDTGSKNTGPISYLDEIKPLYHRDEFSHLVQEWNNLRESALERALNRILYPQMAKELQVKLLQESKDFVVRACSQKLYNWLKVAPYQAEQNLDDDEEDLDSPHGLRVMGITFGTSMDEVAFGVMIDGDGAVTDYVRLPHIRKRKNSWRKEDRENKMNDIDKVKDFISSKRPHVIGVAGISREAMTIMEDLKEVLSELEQESQMSPVQVELVDPDLSTVYMSSNKATQDFREYPPRLKMAISVARRLQDPLIEFCQLCNPDEDILALKYHPLQESVNKDDLLNALNLEFINRVNEVGVDVNRSVALPHTAPLMQFVCGLGPRKGYHLLKMLKQNNSRLENRTQLVTMCHMGPKVFINCAGFIKIDTNSLGDSTEAYVEVLDGSRVHPETYEWARKMAVDALEYDDSAEDANPAGALEEILESPERLKDLDLDAFAEELERQGYGNKHITLYDIRAELNHRYKDLRTPYRPPSLEERFSMLTKETPASFYIGKLITCHVTGIAHRKPRGEQLDNANPVRNDESGLWQCPFCMKNDFPELSEVWNHFDAGECPGQSVGVKTRLDNGVTGFIPIKNLSDKHVTNPEERVRISMTLHCRVTKIDTERFNVELTSKSSDLGDKEGKWKLQKDPYYDFRAAEVDKEKEDAKKKQQARQTYIKRVIAHPSFQNIDYKTCERLMVSMEQGEVIIRPSSKGSDHLTCTWKVSEGVQQHIDIREEGKENAFSLGQSLWIESEEFEDLDEIIARHIQPMAAFARDIINYKYYQDAEGGKREILDKLLGEEKKKGPSKIPYLFSASRQYPGKFVISYLPRKSTKHEFVSVTPDGLRYRGHRFHSISSLIRWFKDHFRDPIPGTPSMRTPMGVGLGQTPSLNLRNVDAAAIQRAAAGLPSSVYNTLAQVAGTTPAAGGQYQGGNFNAGYGASFNYQQQPAVTPMMTPMMTPSYQGGQQMTTPAQQPMATPAHHMTTPAQGQAHMATPQYAQTPRTAAGAGAWNHPGATPSRTPQHTVQTPQVATAVARRQPTPQRQTPSRTPVSNKPSATDWAKAAEMWAKQMKQQGNPKSKGGATPARSPRVEASPAGDATPLFDER